MKNINNTNNATEIKQSLRKEIALLKQTYEAEDLHMLSQKIIHKIEQTQEFANAKCILAYYSFPGEVVTHGFIEKYVSKKKIILPVVQKDKLVLKVYTGPDDLKLSAYGIHEPTGEEFLDYDQIDLAIIPGKVFDRCLNRIGRGKGYYDRLLPKLNSYFMGICYSFQLKNEIPVEAHDIPMNCIISQNEIIV
ncbi:MAG: 5-formyltetrahydrofolate cyclo-ligase [Dysgonamonadaceae bacterium]|nr:5-formyltetrahydrofolate cyclo-ligase [Dysgonamonadaceae bacterium]MDD4728892.1 5-formyltetrahydrofolate cyclo-ligase [Dysgonamonadaceae bacterium]